MGDSGGRLAAGRVDGGRGRQVRRVRDAGIVSLPLRTAAGCRGGPGAGRVTPLPLRTAAGCRGGPGSGLVTSLPIRTAAGCRGGPGAGRVT